MAIFDFLVGKQGLQEQRDRAIDYAQERYDPSTLQPQVNLARERATEGISEGQESMARRRTVESLFRPTDTSIYGGNQARAIAGQQQQNRQAQQGMADFEAQLTQQDLQARQQGQQQFAEARTQQLQTEAQRDAAIEEAEMQYEQELENRRKQLGSTVANLAGTVAGSFLGPAGAAAGGAIAGGLAGGGMGAVQGAGAGFSTAYSRQQSEDMINQLTGGGQTQQEQFDVGQMLTDVARQGVSATKPQDEIIQPQIGDVSQPQMESPMAVPQQQNQQYDFTGGYQNTPSDFMSEQEQNQLLSTLGYNESGQRTQPVDQYEIRQQQQFQTQRLDQTQQPSQNMTPQQQEDELLGEQLYNPASNFVQNLLGSAGSYPFMLGTAGIRGGLNLMDMFGQEYGQARQRMQQEQNVSY